MSWKRIREFPNYAINMSGEVYSFVTHKKLKPYKQRNEYLIIRLFNDGKSFSKYIHRLVGETFLKNPRGLREINHKDGNRQNNSVENLEWVSRSGNMFHKIYVSKSEGGYYPLRSVRCVETGEIYPSVHEAARAIGVCYTGILKALKTGCRARGKHWEDYQCTAISGSTYTWQMRW